MKWITSEIENPSKSEVIGRCGGDGKKPNDHAEPTKSRTLKNKKINLTKYQLTMQSIVLINIIWIFIATL